MTDAALRLPADEPTVDVVPRGTDTLVLLRGWASSARATLDARARRLVAAAVRDALDARPHGGLTVTVELSPRPRDGLRAAAAVMISADAKSVVLAALGRDGVPLAAARLDQATIDALSGDWM
ncbi:hypothetical protein PQJ75_13670 [Rhodoplanes sp. TEM]|uniref:YbaB/EbfC DNA-binding family protein n=1 Tax=Rhodoplanes tepidamans TaxID=200616 RepID=A0ABT5JDI8_RHOTP|nr:MULTISPECIES: hypothetical protein [Rhodoplanes]MDC7787339.1 hypothetical protein [Rhodoplanes tepidamans]MDC7984779.1 hypothetical protein [Rhodoplanes sp. TEM]MDQ0358250.1 mannose/cellobiose epimerase-like protein (N-acyl-D-glucosamine 2-epimerase family) [Rhodoplanes tepidamans]